jgi:sulfite reductase (NADPH) flavoprotein alpha-component
MSVNPKQTIANPGAILNESQWNAITQAMAGLNANQLNWVSGYAAGVAAAQQGNVSAAVASAPTSQAQNTPVLTILYGSQTGNAKGIAQSYQAKVEAAGYTSKLVSMADYKPRQIKNETHIAVVVSTHGEGEAPDDAMELHEFLASKKAPKLADLKYTVIGLGDSSYEFFCQTAKDFDARLSALGATALLPRVECDVDYEAAAEKWSEDTLEVLKSEFSQTDSAQAIQTGVASQAMSAGQTYTKKAPYSATFIEAQKITGRDSVKDIRHIEISLEDSGIQYQAGDALGVWFTNDEQLVDELIALVQAAGDSEVKVADSTLTLRDALLAKLELTISYPGFVKAYQEATNSDELGALLADKAALRAYLVDRQIIDIVREHPFPVSAQTLVDALRPLTPRLYSIASSQLEVEDEVHLTIGHVDYTAFDKRHQGGASGFLCERLKEGANVDVFIEPNDNFRLPENPDTPVIMVGPGTGIAPFRAFMQERDAQGAEGKNWLFFGNPNFTQDFLYQVEWQGYVKSGLLNKITLAFSRDQADKIYVQHRIAEHAAELYAWLEEGAHFYVCGDANHMAKDVENALLEVIKTQGNKSDADAKAYLIAMRKAKRYQKDVY